MRIQFHKGMRRWLSLLLALAMLLPNFPVSAFAQNEDLDSGTICGTPAHTHGTECFQSVAVEVCGFAEGQVHTHSENCFQTVSALICGQEESEEHVHAEECYELQTQSVCALDEVTPHTHSESCYQAESAQICEQAEHTHDAACYPAKKQMKAGARASVVDISGYSAGLHVYNYIRYSNPDGQGTGSIEGVLPLTTGDKTFAYPMVIGAHTDEAGNEEKKPMTNDIQLEFNRVTMTGDMTVMPVYPEDTDEYKTTLNITDGSTLGSLTLEENAVMELTLNAPLTIQGNVTLGKNSKLTINANGQKLILAGVSGSGDLILNDATVNASEAITCGNLTINGTTLTANGIHAANTLTITNANLNANGAAITASGSITAATVSIANATLFGVSESEGTQTVTMRFTGITFIEVQRVGAGDGCTANVRFDGCSASGDTSYYQDFTITYQVENIETPILSYRVKSSALSGDNINATVVSNPELPDYEQSGYTFKGWKTADSEDVITELKDGTMGDLVLYPVTEANDVNVTMDLMFQPSDDNCDDAANWAAKYPLISANNTNYASQSVKIDGSVALEKPKRFGYIFAGWRLKGTDTIINDNLVVSLDKLTDADTLELEAVWEKDSFPLYWTFSSNVPLAHIEMSVDGGANWFNPQEVRNYEDYAAYWEWYPDEKILRSTDAAEIIYGETLGEYFARLGENWQFPIVRDARYNANNPDAQAFLNWSTQAAVLVSDAATFDASASGFLVKPAGQSWEYFQDSVLPLTDPIRLTANFGTADYELQIPAEAQSKWTFLVNDQAVTPVDGVLTVPNGAKVTFACGNSDGLSICNWEFVAENRQMIDPVERVYDGKTKYYYDFIMPACDVDTFYQTSFGAKYVDIAKGAITFVEDADPAGTGIRRDGFWYKGRLVSGTSSQYQLPLLGMTPLCYDAEKGYFYVWNMSNALYVTSDGVATTNQLTLVNANLEIYLKSVNMVAREKYINNAIGRTMYGVAVETPRDTDAASYQSTVRTKLNALDDKLSEMGNIVIPADAQTSETYTLHFIGKDNVVAAVMVDEYVCSGNNKLIIYGEGMNKTSLTLGTVFVNAKITVEKLEINQYEGSNSAYLFHSVAQEGTTSITNCNVYAPDKEIYVKDAGLTLGSGTNGKILIHTLVGGQNLTISSGANVRVLGNVYIGYSTFSINKNSVLVVDGNFLTNYMHWSAVQSSGAVGAVLIVKGSICELGNRTWTAGTLICNTFVVGRVGGVTGGTVVANQIANKVTKNWEIKSGFTEYVFTDGHYIAATADNGDIYPYVTYSQSTATHATYQIGGTAEVYLLGDTAQVGTYDLNRTAEQTNLKSVLDTMLDANGDYVAPVNTTTVRTQLMGNTNNAECIVIGNSTYDTDSRSRSVEISGSAKLYAAGNVTLFNNAVVKDTASVWCGGTFGSKLDLTIEGGNVTAQEVGIAYNLKTTLEDGTIRWKKLTVGGAAHVDANRVGTLSKCASDGNKVLYGTVSLDPSCLEDCELEYDSYVNYLLGTEGFTNPQENQALTSIHVSGILNNGVITYSSEEATFAPPVFNNTEGAWAVDIAQGTNVTRVAANAKLYNGQEETAEAIYDNDRLVLVAIKSQYNMTVRSGAAHVLQLNGQSDDLTLASAAPGQEVSFTLDDAAIASDYTFVWYTDSNGYLRNPGYSAENGTVTFTMPYNDVDIYIAPENGVELDLSRNSVTIMEDGFRTTLDSDATRTFRYKGSITVYQSDTETTLNRILVLADVNNIETNRRFTLRDLYQMDTVADIGLQLLNGAKAHFMIDGQVVLCRSEVPENSEIILEGVDPVRSNNVLDIHDADDIEGPDNRVALGMNSGKAGNMTLANLKIDRVKKTENFSNLGYSKSKNSNAVVTYRNCELPATIVWYNENSLGYNVGKVIVEDCDFSFKGPTAYPYYVFSNCTDIQITNSRILFTDVGGTSSAGYVLFHNTEKVTARDSDIQWNLANSSSTTYKSVLRYLPGEVTLINTKYVGPEHDRFNKLTLAGTTNMQIGAAGEGYLFAAELNVSDNASLKAKGVLVSGYFAPSENTMELQTKEQVIEHLSSANPKIQHNGVLNITGGTVQADLVGGDAGSQINVSGGTLDAHSIGTLGALYGYGQNHPKAGGEWVYTYAKIPEGATVSISGGTVNVSEYLGGMKSEVNITGGKVNLADNAVLGMTDDQRNTLKAHYDAKGVDIDAQKDNIQVSVSGGKVEGEKGTINVPYGELNISGVNTGVKVENILAHYGDINIQDANNAYDNYVGDYPEVGVYVFGDLNGQNISITDRAVVYAQNAIATAPLAGDTALLSVPVGDDNNYGQLYANTIGTAGSGAGSIVGVETITLFPKSNQYSIWYVLNDDATDPADNPNQDFFVNGSIVTLQEPTRYGYEFMGWYSSQEAAQNLDPNEKLTSQIRPVTDLTIYAAWAPKTVEFQLRVDGNDFVAVGVNLASEYAKLPEGTADYDETTNTLTFHKTVVVPYRELIRGTGENSINLSDFALGAFVTNAISFADGSLSGEVQASSTVSREILDFYTEKNKENAEPVPIVLEVTQLIKKNEDLNLHLNQTGGRPVDAHFQGYSVGKNTLTGSAIVGSTISTAAALMVGDKLNQPTAPGYTFDGWYTKDGERIFKDYPVGNGKELDFYAKWEKNQYKIRFDPGENGYVTYAGADAPDPTSDDTGSMDAFVYYDTVINGNIIYSDSTVTGDLPVAWKPGYKFSHWEVKLDGEEKGIRVDSQELNQTTFSGMDTSKIVSDGDDLGPALTLTAVYTPITVTYHTNGGTFTETYQKTEGFDHVSGDTYTSQTNDKNVAYGKPLAGYRIVNDQFTIVSTKAQEFEDNGGKYITGDYRNDLGRKGYTFQGWVDKDGKEVNTLPAYEDIELTARWQANTYELVLYAQDEDGSSYSDISALNPTPNPDNTVTVTVGELIDGTKQADVKDNWPNRVDSWYATARDGYKVDANPNKRYLLGFTFDFLDPGAPGGAVDSEQYKVYNRYASNITSLINHDTLFTKREVIANANGAVTEGSKFFLPESKDYERILIDTGSNVKEVPDYPDGSKIPMYAVYRERSVVFIERYVDLDGNIQEQVLTSESYLSYSEYANDYVDNTRDRFAKMGYTFVYWSVNHEENGPPYPDNESDYSSELYTGWLNVANSLGCYDINVYTVFAAAVESNITLETAQDPAADHAVVKEYPIPGSMAVKGMTYTLAELSEKLKIVDYTTLQKNQYKSANVDDVAVYVELVNSDNVSVNPFWLSEAATTQPVDVGTDIGAGWKIRMTLYHSKVIPVNHPDNSFLMEIRFKGEENQKIDLKTNINMNPTRWTVNYKVELPTIEDEPYRKILENNGFSISGDTGRKTDVNWTYGADLLRDVPVVEGFSADTKWKDSAGNDVTSNSITITEPVPINLFSGYVRNSYTLTDSTNGQCTVATVGEVPYHAPVTINPVDTAASFIWLRYNGDSYRLDELESKGDLFRAEKNNDSYTFLMPPGEVEVVYDDVLDLYLGYGTIDIDEKRYTQNGISVSWTGNYRILQWPEGREFEPTANVLNLADDLSGRTITLGKLDITSDNSIALATEASANLKATEQIIAKNILVPATAVLHLVGVDGDTAMALSPDVGYAAIGGNESANGDIYVTNIDLTAKMPAGSEASVIGSGNVYGNGTVTVNGCDIVVEEGYSLNDGAYRGTWFGGKVDGTVILQATTVHSNTQYNDAAICDGNSVTITECKIGSGGSRIAKHPMRGNNLFINDSQIYLDSYQTTVLAPGSTIMHVDKESSRNGSVIDVINSDELYHGEIKLHSKKSDVVVNSYRLLDLKNGDIKITSTGSVQNGITQTHDGSYRLLNAFSTAETPVVGNVTVNSSAEIYMEKTCKLDELIINANTTLVPLDAVLPVNTLQITKNNTLIVDAADGTGLSFSKSFGGAGHYEQEDGVLYSVVDLTVGGNMKLENVTVSAEGKCVGSYGAANTVTTVTIDGGSVQAATIGAIGAQNETFTFVTLQNVPVITGTLVQDHYRLHYNLTDTKFRKNDAGIPVDDNGNVLPTVLRSSAVYSNGEAANTMYQPAVPADPKYLGTGSSYFGCWYLLDGERKLGLSTELVAGMDSVTTLSKELVTYAADAAEDGTQTLEMYAWMSVSGTGKIAYGRILNAVTSDVKTVAIEENGAWTARFDVIGAGSEAAEYVFEFAPAIPAGTKLTLSYWQNGQPVYYSCITKEDTTKISESAFARMGYKETANLIPDTGAFTAVLQLSADFQNVTAPGGNVALAVQMGESAYPIDQVSYTVNKKAEASCEADAAKVTYQVKPNGDERLKDHDLYLVAEITKGVERIAVPYHAKLTLGDAEGTWLGGNIAYFRLGDFGQLNGEKDWSIVGLPGGDYTVKWYLTAAMENAEPNVFDVILAESGEVSMPVAETPEQELSVTLLDPVYVLSAGTEHVLQFQYTTNGTVSVMLEKQTSLQVYRIVEQLITADPGGTVVNIPGDAGVYRVRFSLDGFTADSSDWDDAYFTFIVKEDG